MMKYFLQPLIMVSAEGKFFIRLYFEIQGRKPYKFSGK
jgi:hypothetical protein